jgi:hypothetical protein
MNRYRVGGVLRAVMPVTLHLILSQVQSDRQSEVAGPGAESAGCSAAVRWPLLMMVACRPARRVVEHSAHASGAVHQRLWWASLADS